MEKKRVFELALDLRIPPSDVLDKARSLGLVDVTIMDQLNEKDFDLLRNAFWVDGIRSPDDDREKISGWDAGRLKMAKDKAKKLKLNKLKKKNFRIEHGDTGYTYENLFGEHLQGAKTVVVEDPYILERYQVENFARFCALLVKIGDAKEVYLVTSQTPPSYNYTPNQSQEPFWKTKRIDYLNNIRRDLKEKGVDIYYKLASNMHPRKIVLDNGWEIIVDRGLDIYLMPDDWYSLESIDFSLRKCKKTDILIRKTKYIPEIIINEYGF